ncbi:sensor histidine kinase [Streptococcus cameli]
MFNKMKRQLQTDNLSYFIRYFALFTCIFTLMTLIILQLMRGTMYEQADENFKAFEKDPTLLLNFALMRGISSEAEVVIDSDNQTDDKTDKKISPNFKPSDKLRLNTNYHVILYNQEGGIVNQIDYISGLANLAVDAEKVNKIEDQTVETLFGQEESYRILTLDVSQVDVIQAAGLDIQYASIVFNTTQITDSIARYEKTVMLVMISFWLVSIFASLYLAKLSVKPLLISFQKQKEFVENASHELRTPLAVLQNRLEALFRKPEATIMESSENIASSLEEVRNMRILTTNLLNLARRDDGIKAEIQLIQPEVLVDALDNFTIMAEESNRELQIINSVSMAFYSDKALIKQLMTILFDNALKYTEEDAQIVIETGIKDKQFVLTVADDGIGISPENKTKIFDRFYRVDKARTRQKGGFGLGLSLAKQILHTLNGTISVRDNHPKGTVFEVRLPIKK